MLYSISNIAWSKENDEEMYKFMECEGFHGIEIAPTRIISQNPYEFVEEAKCYKEYIFNKYGLSIASMQSIWYGRTENIFSEKKQRKALLEYTKKAFLFAEALECKNIVFGCPKNRNVSGMDDYKMALDFFGKLGDLAQQYDTILAIEANPTVYGTNFLTTTEDVYDFVFRLNNPGIKINYDIGTVIYNQENLENLSKYLPVINHVHISEPNLESIQFGDTQRRIIEILIQKNYQKYVSLEMRNLGDVENVKSVMKSFRFGRVTANGI